MSQAYREAGVDIEEGERAVEAMKASVNSTFTNSVLSKMGDFAGLFELGPVCEGKERPVLVASTDGVGTKVDVASKMGRWDTVGQCLVHHCINDILVQGAEPIFFLDFIGCNKLESAKVSQIVLGMAKACGVHGVALLGGETAEMGSTYSPGSYEVAGTIVGLVDYHQIMNGSTIEAGDEVWAFPSSGLHTNGYTLARKICADLDWQTYELEDRPLGEHLLDVHRCYLPEVRAMRGVGVEIRGLAHVTGGGLKGNFKRVLPAGLGAELSLAKLDPPPIFEFLRRRGELTFEDLERTFNLGAGMLVIGTAESMKKAEELHPDLTKLGTITNGSEIVVRS
jgi:phosphoribosylformylglycinamidine cyclo-ligase